MRKGLSLLVSLFSILFFVLVIYMILRKLTGHSPTVEEINIMLTLGIGGLIFKMNFDIGQFTEFTQRSKEDIREVKSYMRELNNKFDGLLEKFS